MDWKWSLCLLVLCPAILAETNQEKTLKGDPTAELADPIKSESTVKLVTSKDINDESKSIANRRTVPIFQIETPLLVNKVKKFVRRKAKPSVEAKVTGDLESESSIESPKRGETPKDPSVAQESLRVENTRSSSPENLDFSKKLKFAPARFVPSEDFPKAAHSHQGLTRLSSPLANGNIKYVLSFSPDSSEESSRSEGSSEEFDSQRQSGFKRHPLSSDTSSQEIRNDIRSRLLRNAIPDTDSQKVTIIKEKTVHSTSSEEEQERVNIEKNNDAEGRSAGVVIQNEPKVFPSSQNGFGQQNTNEKVILIEGTRIPGRNYGPTDDTFGFYTSSYKDGENSPTSGGRRLKIVKVIKSKPNDSAEEHSTNNHGGVDSSEYFGSEQPVITSSGSNVPASNQQTHEGQRSKPTADQSIGDTKQSGGLQKHLETSSTAKAGISSHHSNEQSMPFNIEPDPNELYIDENTGQLIRFVLSEDIDQHQSQKANGKAYNNQEQGKEMYSQRYPEEIKSAQQNNIRGDEYGSGQFKTQQFMPDGYGGQQANVGNNVKYIEIHDDDAIHLIIPGDGKTGGQEEQMYVVSNNQEAGNAYGQEKVHSTDDSGEYTICDQEGQDFSIELQSEGHNQNNANSYGKMSGKSQNDYPSSGYDAFSSGNQKGHSLQEGGYGQNQGNAKGSSYGKKGVTNFATPQPFNGAQSHHKGTSFSNNKGGSKVPVYKENVTPAYPVGEEFNNEFNQNKYAEAGLGNQKGYGGGNNQNYGVSLNSQKGGISMKGHSQFSGLGNQGYGMNSGGYSQGQNKGKAGGQIYVSEEDLLSMLKGNKGSSGFSNQKGYNSGSDGYSGGLPMNLNSGSAIPGSKGYNSGNFGNTGIQNHNSNKGGGSYGGNSKDVGDTGYSSVGSKLPRELFDGGSSKDIKFPEQKGYITGSNSGYGNGGFDSGEELSFSGMKGDLGGSGFMKQNGYSQNNAFSGNKGGGSLRDFLTSKGKGLSSKGEYDSGPLSGNEGYQGDDNLDIFSGAVTSKGFSGGSNNKGYGSENKVGKKKYKSSSITGSISASLSFNKGSGSYQSGTAGESLGYGKGDGGSTAYNSAGNGGGYGSGNDESDRQVIQAHNTFKGLKFKQDNGNSGYGKQSVGNAGYGNQAGGNAGYGNQAGGNAGYGNQAGGNAGYGNQAGGNAGYGNQAGGNAGYGNQVKGNAGYGSQAGGNAKYGKQGGGNANYGNQGSGNKNYGSGNDYLAKQAIEAHNTFKGSNFNQNKQNTGYGKQNRGKSGFGNQGGGNSGYENQGRGKLGFSNQAGSTGYIMDSGENYGSGNNDFTKQAMAAHSAFKGSNLKQNNGNTGYGKQTGGSLGYGSNSGESYSSGSNNLNKQVIQAHNTYKGSKLKQNTGNAGYGKQMSGQSEYGNQYGGNVLGFEKTGGGSSVSAPSKGGNSGYGTNNGANYNSKDNELTKQVIALHNNYKGSNMMKNLKQQNLGKQQGNIVGYEQQLNSGSLGHNQQNRGHIQQNGATLGYRQQGNDKGLGSANYRQQGLGNANYGQQGLGNANFGQHQGLSNANYGQQQGLGNSNYVQHQGLSNSNYGQQQGLGNANYAQQPGLNIAGYGQQDAGNGKQARGMSNGGHGTNLGFPQEQSYNPGNGVYSSSKGNQKSNNQGPVQYVIVEENDPSSKNGNNEGLYMLQYGGNQGHHDNSQEQTYLVIDDSNQLQNTKQKIKVMVDGKKNKLFPIRQLATVGLHMAKAVLPNVGKPKSKSIEGKITFGLEFKKDKQSRKGKESQQYDQPGSYQQYPQDRSDKHTNEADQKFGPIK